MTPQGPGRQIAITPHEGRVTVRLGDTVVARTERALKLEEDGYRAVVYVPRDDVDESVLERTDHTSHCPFKGTATYYSIRDRDRVAENAAWTYESPLPQVAKIRNAVSFYTDRVAVELA